MEDKEFNLNKKPVGWIGILPNGNRIKVLEQDDKGTLVHNFTEEEKIREHIYSKKRCNWCRKKRFLKDLFPSEKDQNKFKCRTCINEEIRLEKYQQH